MGKYVAENTVKKMIQANKPIKGANVAVLGITFKEDCPDSRNTRVIDIIRELKEYGVNVQVIDPMADAQEVEGEYGIHLNRLEDLRGVDAVIFAVAHEEFINLSLQEIKDWYRACPNHPFSAINEEVAATIENGCENNKNVLIDVKGIFDRKEAEELDYLYWRL
jgi:UDP-N-acetyl-D-galactosamine dehydrogenase